ncbi:MAG: ankyrin repeat domain-containing protein [Planctomycetota bacterium]|nr:MAG: ankyrin repeat domain-containing protein [Planctomycetota bacterium]
MSNQKTNSVLVFVAVLVAAIIVIYAIMSNKPKTQPPVDGTVPAEAAGDPAGGEGSDTGAQPDDDVTRIDQTTDTTHGEVPAGGEADDQTGEVPAGGEADDQTGEVPAAAPDEEAPAAPSTLIEAAQAGDLPVLSAMIDSGMNVNATDDGGRTPLMHAAAGGHLDSVFALLNAGANAAAPRQRPPCRTRLRPRPRPTSQDRPSRAFSKTPSARPRCATPARSDQPADASAAFLISARSAPTALRIAPLSIGHITADMILPKNVSGVPSNDIVSRAPSPSGTTLITLSYRQPQLSASVV